MDPVDLLNNLESNQPHIVEDTKKKLQQILTITKEPWLLNGLFDCFLSTNSARAIEILVSVREPHDKFLFDRLGDALKNSGTKLQALTVLGHVLRKQPAWLYRITQHQLLKDLLKLLKTETDILPLLSALLVIVVLLPMIPALIGPFLQDIFDIFSRLAAWNCNPGKLGEEQLVHLQVAMYALFLRLYGMYPCNFLSYLRNHYRQGDNMPVFIHTVKPMLGTVKIHPHLVTASKDNETEMARWKKMGHHDVIVECERFAVDVSGTGSREDSCYTGLRSRSSTMSAVANPAAAIEQQQSLDNIHLQQALKYTVGDRDFWSPTAHFHSQHSSSPPPIPEVCTPQSIPQTPNSQIPNSQNFVVNASFTHQEGTSPPEAAIEATPETTPIKDPRVSSRHLHHHTPVSSTTVRALTSLNSSKWPGLTASTGSTPSHSQPSSPMRKEPSPFRFPTEGSAFEVSPSAMGNRSGREPPAFTKLMRVVQERSQVNESPAAIASNFRVKTPIASTVGPTSPLRVIPRYYESSGSVPNSPVPLADGLSLAPTREWPAVAKPRPEKNGVPISLGTDTSQEDQEIADIVRQGEMQGGSGRSQLCDSVLQEFVNQDDGDFEACCGEPHDLQQGSPCTSGGLHMPNSHSLQAFASRVHRLRYYSQCGPVHDQGSETSTGSSPGQREILPSTIARVRRANSCPEMKKNYSTAHHLNKAALDESDELNISEMAAGASASNISTPTNSADKDNLNVNNFTVSNGVYERRLPQRSTSTQTLDLWPMPYEHLFLGVFPLLEMNTEVRPIPSPSPAPVYSDKLVRFSPYEMLDKYIEQASFSYEHDGKRNKVHSLEAEIKNLREQLGLVHLQLQYERHRREVHAVRNRRLLGESRNNKTLEEHNSALRDQVALLQKEIEHLNAELNSKKREFNFREKELQQVVTYWNGECLTFQDETKALRSANESLQRELNAQVKKVSEVQMAHQKTESELFRLEAELGVALERVAQGDRLRVELEHTQRELMLAGELNQKFREKLAQWPLIEHKCEEGRMMIEAHSDEIKILKQQLDNRNVMIEGQKTQLQELEHASQQRDELCASQKRMLKEVKDRYEEELNAAESKYRTQRSINLSLEERVLELWQRIETTANNNRSVRGAHHSPDTSSCHEAGVTDRTGGGATAGGLSSPHSSSPLSASLTSSEGSMAFLQGSVPGGDVREMKNLQVIVDQTEGTAPTGGSTEHNTPEGSNPTLLYNQSD